MTQASNMFGKKATEAPAQSEADIFSQLKSQPAAAPTQKRQNPFAQTGAMPKKQSKLFS